MAFASVLAPPGPLQSGLNGGQPHTADRSAEFVGSTLLNYHYDDDDDSGAAGDYIRDKMGFSEDSNNYSSKEYYREEPRFASASSAVSYDPWRDIFADGQFKSQHQKKSSSVAGDFIFCCWEI